MSKTLETLTDLYTHELKDVYNAEKQLVKALPKMAKAAHSPELKNAFEEHLEQTQGQINRLERIFSSMGVRAENKKCAGMEGIIKEGEDLLKQPGDPKVIDAGLISSAQRVEHYEMAAYGTLKAYAQELGKKEAFDLLSETLQEEAEADKKLTELAEGGINQEAE